MCEVAQAYPGYTMADLEDMPVVHFTILHERISLGEYRRAYPVAQLEAMLRNRDGGKQPGGKTVPQSQLYAPDELLPSYALPGALLRDLPFSPAQCGAIMDAIAQRELPQWVLSTLVSIMPMSQIMRYGGVRGSGEQDDGFERLFEPAAH